jgi:hypothetical protein
MIMSVERNYRAYCYFRVIGLGPADSIRVESGRSTLQAAIVLLANMATVSNYTGGGIEHKLPGIGWTICEDETECPDFSEGE